jgi:hypothetical protein
MKTLRKSGVHPSISQVTGREYNRGEYRELPRAIRKRNGAYSLDDLRFVFADEGLISQGQLDDWTHNDTLDFFERYASFNRRLDTARARRKAEKIPDAPGEAA